MATYFQGAVKSKNGLHVVVGGTGTVNVLYT